METRQSKKVSSACLYCKARKRKCSTKQPCENCIASKRKCEFRNSEDGRRRESFQRIRIGSAFYKQLLHSLLRKLRQGRDEDLNTLIEENPSFEALAAYLVVALPRSDRQLTSAAEDVPNIIVHNDEDSQDLGTLLMLYKTLTSSNQVLQGVRSGSQCVDHSGLATPFATEPTLDPEVDARGCQISEIRRLPYEAAPLNIPADRLSVSALFMHYRDSCRIALLSVAAEEVILGPATVNLDAALIGCRISEVLTPSAWICELQQKFESFDVYVRLICIHFIHRYLQWVISPTSKNYDLLPECMRPTSLQCIIPHHAAIDLCYLPALRDILVQRCCESHTASNTDREDIVVFQLAGLQTCWTGGWDEAVMFDHDFGHYTLTQQFINTASRVDEWIAGHAALEQFPGLAGKMRFAQVRSIPVDDRQLHELVPRMV